MIPQDDCGDDAEKLAAVLRIRSLCVDTQCSLHTVKVCAVSTQHRATVFQWRSDASLRTTEWQTDCLKRYSATSPEGMHAVSMSVMVNFF